MLEPLVLDDPKSAPSNSFAVRGGGSFEPEIITLIAPGSRESRKIPLHNTSSTAKGLVGYKFMQMDCILGRKYQSKPLPPTFAICLERGLMRMLVQSVKLQFSEHSVG